MCHKYIYIYILQSLQSAKRSLRNAKRNAINVLVRIAYCKGQLTQLSFTGVTQVLVWLADLIGVTCLSARPKQFVVVCDARSGLS